MASLTSIAFVTFGVIYGANAWGALGHATVAYVAQHYLSSEAASWYVTQEPEDNGSLQV